MQRALTSQLAEQSGLEVISFQHCDCLLFEREEALKMFLPKSKRVMGGTAQDRMVIGDMLVIFRDALERLRPPSQRFKFVNFVVGIPIANFPAIVPSSMISDGTVDDEFFQGIRRLLDALPNNKLGWSTEFGEGFLACRW